MMDEFTKDALNRELDSITPHVYTWVDQLLSSMHSLSVGKKNAVNARSLAYPNRYMYSFASYM